MSKPLLALIEFRWWGHHSSSFMKFIHTAQAVGFNVIGFFPKEHGISAHEIDEERAIIETIPDIHHFLDNQPNWTKQLRIEGLWRWWKLKKLISQYEKKAKCKFDHVFICMLDDFISGWLPATVLTFVFPYKWSALFLWPWRGDKQYGGSAPIFTPAKYRWQFTHAKNCQCLFTIDEYFVKEQTKQRVHLFSDKWSHFPEYEENFGIDDKIELSQTIREKAQGKIIIGLIGIIDVRKGIHTLLEVAKKSQNRDWFFVFVGTGIDANRGEYNYFVAKANQSNLSNCLFHFKFLPTQKDFYSIMSCFDIVFLSYINFYYPSGNLAYSALLEKPVIVSDGGIMARRVLEYNLGLVVKQDSPVDTINAITQITNGLWKPDKKKWNAYYATQSKQALMSAFLKVKKAIFE